MSDYIAWYSVELRLRLSAHMPSAKVESVIKEAESHLREAAERLKTELQLSDESATLAAIDAFGKPEKVALTHLRESGSRIFGIKPVWFVLACGLVALLCWDFHWMSLAGPFDNRGETWQNGIAGFVGGLALIGFVLGCRAGRRSFRLPVLALGGGLAVASAFFVSYMAITSGASYSPSALRPNLSQTFDVVPKSISRLDRYQALVERGTREFAAAKTTADLSRDMRDLAVAEAEFGIAQYASGRPITPEGRVIPNALVTPADYVYASPDGGFSALQGAESFESAKKRWASVSPNVLANVNFARGELRNLLSRATEARNGRTFFFNGFVVTQIVCWTIVFLPALLFLDWATFAMIRRKRAWPVRGLA